MSELDRHIYNVGRVAVAATQLETATAHLIHAGTTGNWDNTDDWLPWATSTVKRKEGLAGTEGRYPEITELASFGASVTDLLGRRNKIVHAIVRYSFFETTEDYP
jgi:hypothetical protein